MGGLSVVMLRPRVRGSGSKKAIAIAKKGADAGAEQDAVAEARRDFVRRQTADALWLSADGATIRVIDTRPPLHVDVPTAAAARVGLLTVVDLVPRPAWHHVSVPVGVWRMAGIACLDHGACSRADSAAAADNRYVLVDAATLACVVRHRLQPMLDVALRMVPGACTRRWRVVFDLTDVSYEVFIGCAVDDGDIVQATGLIDDDPSLPRLLQISPSYGTYAAVMVVNAWHAPPVDTVDTAGQAAPPSTGNTHHIGDDTYMVLDRGQGQGQGPGQASTAVVCTRLHGDSRFDATSSAAWASAVQDSGDEWPGVGAGAATRPNMRHFAASALEGLNRAATLACDKRHSAKYQAAVRLHRERLLLGSCHSCGLATPDLCRCPDCRQAVACIGCARAGFFEDVAHAPMCTPGGGAPDAKCTMVVDLPCPCDGCGRQWAPTGWDDPFGVARSPASCTKCGTVAYCSDVCAALHAEEHAASGACHMAKRHVAP
jgi:hypothetical protein